MKKKQLTPFTLTLIAFIATSNLSAAQGIRTKLVQAAAALRQGVVSRAADAKEIVHLCKQDPAVKKAGNVLLKAPLAGSLIATGYYVYDDYQKYQSALEKYYTVVHDDLKFYINQMVFVHRENLGWILLNCVSLCLFGHLIPSSLDEEAQLLIKEYKIPTTLRLFSIISIINNASTVRFHDKSFIFLHSEDIRSYLESFWLDFVTYPFLGKRTGSKKNTLGVLYHEMGHIYHNHSAQKIFVVHLLKDNRIPETLSMGILATAGCSLVRAAAPTMPFPLKCAALGYVFFLSKTGSEIVSESTENIREEFYYAFQRKNEREADAFVVTVATDKKDPELLDAAAEEHRKHAQSRPYPYPSPQFPLSTHPGDQERIDYFTREAAKLRAKIDREARGEPSEIEALEF